MTNYFACSLLLLFTLATCSRIADEAPPKQKEGRQGKLGLFTIYKFKNDPCVGSGSRNGTCLTPSECGDQGGQASGPCIDNFAFAVCCIFVLECGQTSRANGSHLVLPSSKKSIPNPCTFTVCKANSDICRIRFDFMKFQIGGPMTTGNDTKISGCNNDRFSITSPGNNGSPIICGSNTGQHMFLDASDLCHSISLSFGSTPTTREIDIKVTQYGCDQADLGGPPGCLQYFTGASGTLSIFSHPAGSSLSKDSKKGATALAGQSYSICFRQEENFCKICFSNKLGPNPFVQRGPGFRIGIIFNNTDNKSGRDPRKGPEDMKQSNCTASTPFRIQFDTDMRLVMDGIMKNGTGTDENGMEPDDKGKKDKEKDKEKGKKDKDKDKEKGKKDKDKDKEKGKKDKNKDKEKEESEKEDKDKEDENEDKDEPKEPQFSPVAQLIWNQKRC